jgi:hypothetical protein
VPIPTPDAVGAPLSYDEHGSLVPSGAAAHHVRSVRCRTCGGTTELAAKEAAGRCVFCKTPFVDAPSERDVLRPHGVLPFAIERAKASETVATWIGSRRFAPRALAREASVERINGVYVSAWRINAKTATDYAGERGVRRTRHRTVSDGSGGTKTETETVTDWYPVSGHVALDQDDVDVVAGKGLEDDLASSLEGSLRSQHRAFRDEYLYGFSAESYDVPLPTALDTAKGKMASKIDRVIKDEIGGDEQRVQSQRTSYSAVTFWLLLLPAWVIAYQYRGKAYQVVIDGYAGGIKGKRPFSPAKIIAAVVIVVALIVALIIVL